MSDATAIRRPAPREARASRFPVQGGKLVLVVEDNEDVLALARETLEEMGHRVLAAASGDEALRVLDREGPCVDLLFTDLIMPEG